MNFANEVAETQRLNNLSKIDQGMNGDVRVQMWTSLTSKKSRPYIQNHPEGLLKKKPALTTMVSNSLGLGWTLRICVSKKYADAVGLGTTL